MLTSAVLAVVTAAAGKLVNADFSMEELEWCISNMECDDFSSIGPPPVFNLPPPPLPDFLAEGMEGDNCDLCDWAVSNDSTGVLYNTDPEPEASNSWIAILVVVAIGSALAGAVLMICLLKCIRVKTGALCKGSCWWSTAQRDVPDERPPSENGLKGRTDSSDDAKTWYQQFWKRTPNDQPFKASNSSPSDETSYAGDPYVSGDSESAVYAELNSISQPHSMSSHRHYCLNTYCEIPDPAIVALQPPPSCVADGNLPRSPRSYENTGFLMIEPNQRTRNGSPSTSSSAYYSDISNQDNRTRRESQRRSQKRRSKGRGSSEEDKCLENTTVSKRVPMLVVPHMVNGICSYLGNFIPDNMEVPPPMDPLLPPVRPTTQMLNAAQVQVHLCGGETNLNPPSQRFYRPFLNGRNLNMPMHSSGGTSDVSINGDADQYMSSQGSSSDRPLPPVPSGYV